LYKLLKEDFYPIFEWSFIPRLSINWVSDELRSPDWSGGLVTSGTFWLFVNNGTVLVVGFVDVGWRISSKKFSKYTIVKIN
jgi:hypothetical protein